MAYAYDDQNIFAKILRGEIPNDTVYENGQALAFRDISPAAPTHVLVIPKGPYVSMDHFTQEASEEELVGFMRAIGEVCRLEGISDEGFRAISNTGHNGVQEVPHLHVHIIGGRPLGRMLMKPA
ncbi:histidine triad nucleotide-binding protein [Litoreibacter janthinus]|uniref:Histidine triad (HIT) family protein n=1 Tax=Litoreibacter janthinus TaxID=670154 RepID=A0A1I6G8M8_9RHOB|nr:histidine triad nucleotide-binding protein [Litoreibacter janthinus]SFR38417.1 histidine triad (HIT) family protein [Litoreibacter janthinus]